MSDKNKIAISSGDKVDPGWMLIFQHLPPLLLLFGGVVVASLLFNDLENDTLLITNAAFAISATVSALAFQLASANKKNVKEYKQIIFSAERFFHAALLLLIASLLKYGAQQLIQHYPDNKVFVVFSSMVAMIAGVLFLWAITTAHAGLIRLNNFLWKKVNSLSGWDTFFGLH